MEWLRAPSYGLLLKSLDSVTMMYPGIGVFLTNSEYHDKIQYISIFKEICYIAGVFPTTARPFIG